MSGACPDRVVVGLYVAALGIMGHSIVQSAMGADWGGLAADVVLTALVLLTFLQDPALPRRGDETGPRQGGHI